MAAEIMPPSRAQDTWPLVGRLARPDMRPARTMSGIAAKGKCPARRLASRRVAPTILLAEELPDVPARRRDIARCLQGQNACETARGTVENDGGHRLHPRCYRVSSRRLQLGLIPNAARCECKHFKYFGDPDRT